MEPDHTDPLKFLPMEKWGDLEMTFLADWPRGIPAYNALVTQKKIAELGLDYGFKVYRPRGDISSGMVALNKKATFYEIIVQCPKDDTTRLEEALLSTKLIDWSNIIIVPFTPLHVVECVQRVAERLSIQFEARPKHNLLFFSKEKTIKNISLPEDIHFQYISEDDVDITDANWVNRYSSSKWIQRLFAKAKLGYGLFKNNQLVSWAYVNEIGSLTHLFTLKEYRKLGLGRIVVQLICNARKKEGKDTFAFCMDGNEKAHRVFQSVGFEKLHPVQWVFLRPRNSTVSML